MTDWQVLQNADLASFGEGGGGGHLFHSLFTNWKSGTGAISVQIFILAYTGIKLGKYQELQVF